MESRYSDMIGDYLIMLNQHFRQRSGGRVDERLLNLMKGKNVYRQFDRSKVTDEADIRTMKSFLRSIGAIDDEDAVTLRGQEILETGLSSALQKYIPRLKVISPQSKKKTAFKKGSRQSSYGSYRLRLFLMILQAAKIAEDLSVDCTIDDVALTACRFWPLSETQSCVTEEMCKARILLHFSAKQKSYVDYEKLFADDLDSAMKDSDCLFMSESEIARKYRNTADNVNNYFRLLHAHGLVVSQKYVMEQKRWSLCQFSDGKTTAVGPARIKLTDRGQEILVLLRDARPIWLLDIFQHFGSKKTMQIDQTLYMIDLLARTGEAHNPEDEEVIEAVRESGISLVIDKKVVTTDTKIDFDWCYDMHTTGKSVKKIFGKA